MKEMDFETTKFKAYDLNKYFLETPTVFSMASKFACHCLLMHC